ncbi:hypothetical protein ACSBR1_015868 [Camellia fascicularis]
MLEGDGRDKCMPLGEEKIFDPSVRNLSNLNLGGEISPAIGDLKNLQSIGIAVSMVMKYADNIVKGFI